MVTMSWAMLSLLLAMGACMATEPVDTLEVAVVTLEIVPHTLYTHCGIEYTEVDGSLMVADISDPPLLPFETPMRWQDPQDTGKLSIRSDGTAIYHGDSGLIMRFEPAPPLYEPPGCY